MKVKEFFEKLPEEQRSKIILKLQEKKVPYNTAYSWINGSRTPHILAQATICDIIQDTTGKKVEPEKLWPTR